MPKVKRLWIIVGSVVGVLLIGALIVQHLLDADTYRGRIETAISDALGRPAQLGHLDFSLFSGSLVAEAPSIADDPAFSRQPFLTAKDVDIGVEMMPLIFHQELHITSFTINQPKIMLLRAENGTWNYSSIGSEGKRKAPSAQSNSMMPNLTVGEVDIKGGTITVGTVPQQGTPHVYSDVNLGMQNFSFLKAFPYTLSAKLPGGGSLDVSGNAGPMNQRDASLTPLTAQVALKHADLVAAGFVEPSQGISGIADLNAKAVSNGRTAQVDGKLNLTQLKLAKNGSPSSQPVSVPFSISQDLESLSGRIEHATLQVGKAAVAMAGTYQTRGNRTTTQISLNGQNVPIDELVTFLPSLGIQLPPSSRLQGGTLTSTLTIRGPTTGPVITGPIHIVNTQLAGFDLGKKLASVQALSGANTGSNTVIQDLSTNLRYGPDGTRTDNLVAVIAGLGSATGGGSISPTGGLNYQLIVKINTASGVGGLATTAMSLIPGQFGSTMGQAAKNGIPVTITGTTSNPTFTPDLSKMMSGSPQQKNMQANPLGQVLGGFLKH
jgi:AsmA protein